MTERSARKTPKSGTWDELDARELEILVAKSSTETEPEEPCADTPIGPPAPEDETKTAPRRPGWPPAWRREPPAHDLFGLALSGGGIRSATFNLGVLQGLAEKGLLDCFHYLSSVSGGGYIGGFWSAWRARTQGKTKDLFPPSEPTRTRPETPEVRHLREFSNFLRPRTSLFEIETARMVSALISGVLPCILIAFAAILLTLGLWWTLAWLFTGEGPGAWRPGWSRALPWLTMAIYAAVTSAILAVTERRLWKRSKPREEPPTSEERGGYWKWATAAIVLSFLLAGGVWFLAPSPALLLLGVPIADLPTALANALFPALPWLIVALLLLGVRVTFSRCFDHDWKGRMRQAAADRTMTRLVLAAATWSALAAAWVGGQLVAEAGVSGVLGALGTGSTAGGLFAWLRRTLFAQSNDPAGRSLLARLGFTLYKALAYVTLIAIAAGGAALIVVIFTRFGSTGLRVLVGAVGLVAVSALFMDPHEVGLHKFYRARLVRAYLGPSNARAYARGTAEAEKDDLELRMNAEPNVHVLPNKPLHLICCAANDLAGDPLGSLGRGAESAVASKLGLQVGDRYRRWECMKSGAPWLSDVLTASGAAFNSHMGQISARLGKAVTFLLTALGLRLGLWLENPADPKAPEEKPSDPTARKRPWGYLFLRELVSDSRVDSPWIHLSDGAHFENLALYELVRRHCRFILLSDCGADPEHAFDDFGNAVRRVREDFGVEIEIDISPIRPDPVTGKSRQPMVAGDILYPSDDPKKKGDVGVLLYVKPTLTGKEPPDVAQYAKRNERFPHESTIDQFYDEAQWESYRRLGRHAIESALEPVESYLPHREGKQPHEESRICGAAYAFMRARYYWLPVPTEEPNFDRLEKEWSALEDRLDCPVKGKDERTDGVRKLRGQLSLRGTQTVTAPAMSEAEFVEALPAVREAIRLMEQVFLRTEFRRDNRIASNRLYMGWLNRFGFWASAPVFQEWWPWLAPFRSGDFTDFMQKVFGLRSTVPLLPVADCSGETKEHATSPERTAAMEEKRTCSEKHAAPKMNDPTGPVTVCFDGSGAGGYARSRYDARPKTAEPGDEQATAEDVEISELYLKMPLTGTLLNAAVLRVKTKTSSAEPPKPGRKVACWTPADLYVPPGLWGISVGETFVRVLLCELPKKGFTHVEVRATKEPSTFENALYMGAGFLREKKGNEGKDWSFVLDLEEYHRKPSTDVADTAS